MKCLAGVWCIISIIIIIAVVAFLELSSIFYSALMGACTHTHTY